MNSLRRGGGAAAALLAGLAVGAVAGCARDDRPLGIPPAEWETLTPQQQAEAEAEDQRLQQAFAVRDRLDRRAAERYAAIAEAGRATRVAERRASGRTGDVINCLLAEGEALSPHGGWGTVGDVPFSLARGELRAVLLERLDGESAGAVWTEFTDSGQALRLCPLDPRTAEPSSCTVLGGTFRDLSAGMTWTVELPLAFYGEVRCAFAPGAPVRTLDLRPPAR